MRNTIFVAILASSVVACAAHTSRSTTPARYACDDVSLVATGDALAVMPHDARGDVVASVDWADDSADHFVTRGVEYVIPRDARADAQAVVYAGPSHARMARRDSCTAERGYTRALALFARGKSLTDVATTLQLSGAPEARDLVHDALLALQRRYFASH